MARKRKVHLASTGGMTACGENQWHKQCFAEWPTGDSYARCRLCEHEESLRPRPEPVTPKSKQRGGYRHGVPGGGAQTRIAIDCLIDLKERWREASIRAGFHETRGLVPFIIELVEAGIKARGLDKQKSDADLRENDTDKRQTS